MVVANNAKKIETWKHSMNDFFIYGQKIPANIASSFYSDRINHDHVDSLDGHIEVKFKG